MSRASAYRGNELLLFAEARHWKSYWSSLIRPWVRGHVLEVGAGLGVNLPLLFNGEVERWLCLEPDPDLAARIPNETGAGEVPGPIEVHIGTTEDLIAQPEEETGASLLRACPLSERPRFDTILYIDVLEHIEDDRAELTRAASLLAPQGHLLVLAPAHQELFSKFDDSIGHYRRYDRHSLTATAPSDLTLVRVFYIDAVGVLASYINRLLLRQASPNPKQIRIWDRCMVPVSRRIDPMLRWKIGKSVIGIWQCLSR